MATLMGDRHKTIATHTDVQLLLTTGDVRWDRTVDLIRVRHIHMVETRTAGPMEITAVEAIAEDDLQPTRAAMVEAGPMAASVAAEATEAAVTFLPVVATLAEAEEVTSAEAAGGILVVAATAADTANLINFLCG
jgi:hypothetical protein